MDEVSPARVRLQQEAHHREKEEGELLTRASLQRSISSRAHPRNRVSRALKHESVGKNSAVARGRDGKNKKHTERLEMPGRLSTVHLPCGRSMPGGRSSSRVLEYACKEDAPAKSNERSKPVNQWIAKGLDEKDNKNGRKRSTSPGTFRSLLPSGNNKDLSLPSSLIEKSHTSQMYDRTAEMQNGIYQNAQTSNPFAGASTMPPNPFLTSTPTANHVNPFAPNPFAANSANQTHSGASTASNYNPFSNSPSVTPTQNGSQAIGAPSKATFGSSGGQRNSGVMPSSGSPDPPKINISGPAPGKHLFGSSKPNNNPFAPRTSSPLANTCKASDPPPKPPTQNALGKEINLLLRKKGILAPTWPTDHPGDPSQKTVMEAFWQNMKGYRAKVRSTLIASGKIDDPDKPKRLEDAIDFKGTCEEMCPEFETITRIVEHDVQGPEKDIAPDGQSLWPSTKKMVKALARSAAGQDAPLPEDIRSPAALRRTVDYLIGSILGTNELLTVHGFLWDRTRAIRRDFVFLQSSMNGDELRDHVYCLETIARFHVVSLHQMVRQGVAADGFSEQQEVEQLGKALLSLIQAYEDCGTQQIECGNEAEFRAYYVLFNGQNPAILETVQDWGFKFWGASEHIKTAVHLTETLQNTWDRRGPLAPHSATDIGPNEFSRFFKILKDRRVSYIMACFAEIHFNRVRKATLKTILSAYRRQKEDCKDWTLDRLNQYLHFDDLEDIIIFGEAYGLQFDEDDQSIYLSFKSNETMDDPFPPLKQPHSVSIVEQKRGTHTLPETIQYTVYGEEEPKKPVEPANSLIPAVSSISDPKPVTTQPPASLSFMEAASTMQTTPFSFTNPIATTTIQPPPVSFPSTGSTMTPQTTPFSFAKQQNSQQQSQPTNQLLAAPQVSTGTMSVLEKQAVDKAAISLPSQVPTSSLFSFPSKAAEAEPIPSQSVDVVEMTSPFSFLGSSTVSNKLTENPPTTSSTIKANNLKPSDTAEFKGQVEHRLTSPSDYTGTIELPATRKGPPVASFFPSTSVGDTSLQAFERPSSTAQQEHEPRRLTTQSFAPSSPVLPQAPLPTVPTSADTFKALNHWIVKGKNGLMHQFTEYQVNAILQLTFQGWKDEERERLRKEDQQRTETEITSFRRRSLSVKYAYMWREKARHLWLRRRGREDRASRRKMAEDHIKAEAAKSAARTARVDNVVDDFRASTMGISKRRNSDFGNSSSRNSNNLQNSLTESDRSKRIRRSGPSILSHLGPNASSVNSSASCNQRMSTSESTMRTSKLIDRSSVSDIMIQGMRGSMIGHIPDYDPEEHKKKRPYGVLSPRWRLQARGIVTLSDGSPLARSAAIEFDPANIEPQKRTASLSIHRKADQAWLKSRKEAKALSADDSRLEMYGRRSLDSSGTWRVPKVPTPRSTPAPEPSSVPVTAPDRPKTSMETDSELQEIKARARRLVAIDAERRDQHIRRKRSSDASDDELFARAKKVREQMDEGAAWFRQQSANLSRSPSGT